MLEQVQTSWGLLTEEQQKSFMFTVETYNIIQTKAKTKTTLAGKKVLVIGTGVNIPSIPHQLSHLDAITTIYIMQLQPHMELFHSDHPASSFSSFHESILRQSAVRESGKLSNISTALFKPQDWIPWYIFKGKGAQISAISPPAAATSPTPAKSTPEGQGTP